jgi:hypothetical protein
MRKAKVARSIQFFVLAGIALSGTAHAQESDRFNWAKVKELGTQAFKSAREPFDKFFGDGAKLLDDATKAGEKRIKCIATSFDDSGVTQFYKFLEYKTALLRHDQEEQWVADLSEYRRHTDYAEKRHDRLCVEAFRTPAANASQTKTAPATVPSDLGIVEWPSKPDFNSTTAR